MIEQIIVISAYFFLNFEAKLLLNLMQIVSNSNKKVHNLYLSLQQNDANKVLALRCTDVYLSLSFYF